MRNTRTPLVSRDGFSLVSVLVAMVLLAVGVVALSSSSAFLMSMQTDTSIRSTATTLAIAYMEEVKCRPARTLASEAPTSIDEIGLENPDGHFVRSLTVTEDPNALDVVKAMVDVEYPAGLGRTGRVEMVTIIYRGNE